MQKLSEGYSWDLDGFDPYRFQQADGDVIPITYLAADHIFRLIPEPGEKLPQAEYIQKAQETHDLKYIMFFLHHYENYFNYWIGSFTAQDYFWTAEHFLDMKLACRETVLEVFPRYDPSRGILFTTFLKPFIWDALRLCRLCYDTWSVESLADFKKIRLAAALFNRCGNVYQAEEEFARQEQCSDKLARQYVAWAKLFWNRKLPVVLDVDDDGWERDEELFQDHWDYHFHENDLICGGYTIWSEFIAELMYYEVANDEPLPLYNPVLMELKQLLFQSFAGEIFFPYMFGHYAAKVIDDPTVESMMQHNPNRVDIGLGMLRDEIADRIIDALSILDKQFCKDEYWIASEDFMKELGVAFNALWIETERGEVFNLG